jgi:hypothetical protein
MWLQLLSVCAAGQTSAPVRQPAPPCVVCQILSVEADRALTMPDHLNGMRVLVRVAPETAEVIWRHALSELRRRGARAGLHVVGVPAENAEVLNVEVDALLIEPAVGDLDRLAFDLKRALAAARGAHKNAILLVAASTDLLADLRLGGLAPYGD